MRAATPPQRFCLLALLLAGCHGSSESASHKSSQSAPAKVAAVPNEAHLADVELTPQAFERLGITTAPVVRRSVAESRTLGGELAVPPGESAVVVAPVSGTVQAPAAGTPPAPGSTIDQGQEVFQFLPLLTPERFVPTPAERAQMANAQASLVALRLSADGDVLQFTEQVSAARIALERAQQLLNDRVGSARAVDDARAQLAIAEAGLRAARDRQTLLDKLSPDNAADVAAEQVAAVAIESPIGGVVRTMPVAIGQTVAGGTTLFEVANLSTLWVRVPAYVGLLDDLRLDEPAVVRPLGESGRGRSFRAAPIEAPPMADPLSSTVDLFYRVEELPAGADNSPGAVGERTPHALRPGERVAVEIPLAVEAESLVVPPHAILYDIHGDTWVYTVVEERRFRRARVSVRRMTAEWAVLRHGPAEGTRVVVDGAAEVFGTEFGTGK